jgi:hypothetical protein
LNDPVATGGMAATGINDAGQIVGYYSNGGPSYGFLSIPNHGFEFTGSFGRYDSTCVGAESHAAADLITLIGVHASSLHASGFHFV